MAGLALSSVRKRFGSVEVIHDVNLTVADGEFVVFVGQSGCGKSTLLRIIAGLEDTSSGTVRIGDEDVTDKEPADRGVAMVFQSYALYPHMTVSRNLSFGLRMNGVDKAEVDEKVSTIARMLQLDTLMDRKPRQLSGGQRQRVAIGRALVRSPRLFLFDEPLSNLDAELRVQMRVEIARLHEELGITTIYVTHDQVEAMTLADRIMVLNKGRVEQIGRPLDLYDEPANLFVAGFIGSPRMNFLPAKVINADSERIDLRLPNDRDVAKTLKGPRPKVGEVMTAGIRPEHLVRSAVDDADLVMTVDYAEHLGSDSLVYGIAEDGTRIIFQARNSRDARSKERIGLAMPDESLLLFDGQGKRVS